MNENLTYLKDSIFEQFDMDPEFIFTINNITQKMRIQKQKYRERNYKKFSNELRKFYKYAINVLPLEEKSKETLMNVMVNASMLYVVEYVENNERKLMTISNFSLYSSGIHGLLKYCKKILEKSGLSNHEMESILTLITVILTKLPSSRKKELEVILDGIFQVVKDQNLASHPAVAYELVSPN